MGLQSAMTTALTGLQAAETTIDVVGNNVANSNTVGFKESEALFATQFLQTLSIGSGPSTNTGGTNSRQIGLGVKVAEISPNFTQGTIEISSSPLDVAIQGDGFLIVQGGTSRLYTRNGQLKLNSQNEIVTTTGQRLLGYGVNDDFEVQTDNLVNLQIPIGQERVAQNTETANFGGVLNPSVDPGGTPEIVESSRLSTNAIVQPDIGAFADSDIIVSDPPSAPTLSEVGATGGPAAGTYRYRVAFLDDNGLQGATTSDLEITSVGGVVQLDNLPPATGQFTERIIYRTEAGGDDFYPLETINDASTTTQYNDAVSDATLTGGGTISPVEDPAIDPGSYTYYVTFVDPSDGTETRPTSLPGSVGISEEGRRVRLDLSDLQAPTGADSRFTKMRLYRNVSGSSTDHRLLTTTDLDAPGTSGFQDSYIDSTPSSQIATNATLDFDGPRANAGSLLVDLRLRSGEVYNEVFEEGVLTFSAEKDGVDTAEKQLEITSSTTVQQLIDFMQQALGIDPTSSVASVPFPSPPGRVEILDGKLVVTSNRGEENAIDIPLTAFSVDPTGPDLSRNIPLNFGSIQQADGPGTSSEFIAYDSLGLPIKVRVTTVLETSDSNSTTYRWYATSADNEPNTGVSTVVGNGILVFDGNGDLDDSTPTARISVTRSDTASESPLQIDLDFDSVKSLGETDAQGNPISALNVTSQDGFPPGVLTDFVITDDGLIQGQFSNGTQRTVGQIVMARFANNQGLQQVGDSLFNIGVNSGEPIFSTPGGEGIGTLTSGAVELSNTDIGQNLIELILASTQYRGGARVISAAQELLDELLALRR